MGNSTDQRNTDHDFVQRLALLEKESEQRRKAEQFTQAKLNSLSAHIAILDECGIIV